jgi:hypothetical protein
MMCAYIMPLLDVRSDETRLLSSTCGAFAGPQPPAQSSGTRGSGTNNSSAELHAAAADSGWQSSYVGPTEAGCDTRTSYPVLGFSPLS